LPAFDSLKGQHQVWLVGSSQRFFPEFVLLVCFWRTGAGVAAALIPFWQADSSSRLSLADINVIAHNAPRLWLEVWGPAQLALQRFAATTVRIRSSAYIHFTRQNSRAKRRSWPKAHSAVAPCPTRWQKIKVEEAKNRIRKTEKQKKAHYHHRNQGSVVDER
jgi:hypothetical protein